MPDRHRAAALRLQWARLQHQAGATVWPTPPVHTWDAWLAMQWRAAVQRGEVPPAQLLSASQERAVWEEVLAAMAAPEDDPALLTAHAGSLMRAAARATQSCIDLAATAHSSEERLLVAGLQAVRALCEGRGLQSLRLAPAESLGFLGAVPAPLVVGELRLTPLQQALHRRCWPAAALLLEPTGLRATPQRLRASDLQQELDACAAWCRAHLQRDPEARLLVLSACTEPGLAVQAGLLWRSLQPDAAGDEALRRRWLAVEAGVPLLLQALIADAFAALELATAPELQTEQVCGLLRSPYFAFGGAGDAAALAEHIARPGLAVLARRDLRELLQQSGNAAPAATTMLALLDGLSDETGGSARASATTWATRFSSLLDGVQFARGQPLDSREHQRRLRWHALLDEFATLDAVLPAMRAGTALHRLRRLAAQARQEDAPADAAITFSDVLGDPVAAYTGIWVLGLAEQRWPAAPRPDPWIAAEEQRRARWADAGVTQRREQAAWALDCWQVRTTDLVLTHPLHEEDLVHHASALAGAEGEWTDLSVTAVMPAVSAALRAHDAQFMPVEAITLAEPLRGGAGLLATQQECPFRAQAQFRLLAQPPPRFSDGIPAWMRGRLLHALLQAVWTRLRDQQALLALDATQQEALLETCWSEAVATTRGVRWLPETVLQRERERARRLVNRVLDLERERAPFRIRQLEHSLHWRAGDARLALRIDRVDAVDSGALLLDYKSGAASRTRLHLQSLDPLQLALYAATLAQQGDAPVAAALLNLDPAAPQFSGAGRDALLPGVQAMDDWDTVQIQWQQALLVMVGEHLSGDGTLARDPQVCLRCHLPALCRRDAAPDEEAEDG